MPYDLGLLQEAIKQQESGGDYNVVNSDSGARGAYQFMPETWADATNRAGLDPNDWSPQNQDAAARFLMGEYMNQFNDPELAARAWYGGPGNVQGSIDSDEGNYPTIRQYGQQVVQKMQQLAGGATPFTFNAKDADGNSFLKMNAYLRTSNPNEAFDQQSIMSIFGNQQTSPQYTVSDAYLAGPHYDMDLLKYSKKRASLLEPFVNKLMQNRAVDEQSFLASQAQQKKLQQAIGLSQLIGQSDNVDNRNAYAAIGHLFGVDVPTGTDQFITGPGALKTQIEMNNAERTYNLNKQKMAQDQANADRNYELAKQRLALDTMKATAGSSRRSGGSSGGGKTQTPDNAEKIMGYLRGNYVNVANAARDGSMSREQILDALAAADRKNQDYIMFVEGGEGGPLTAYNEQARNEIVNVMQGWYGDDMNNQDKTWTNNPVSRFLGVTTHDEIQ